ncbi:MAG: hypothetical protein P4L35_00485 [Ignavibacteriaceae bacterium]|nr:hypothetical protein [Ignavibacteriaceae bacterium]
MNPYVIFCLVLLALLILVVYFNIKYDMLKDISTAKRKPYSFSKVQLAWWSVIIIASFTSIIIVGHVIPAFNQSIIILLGISSGTTAAARLIDISDKSNPLISRTQDDESA